MKIAEALIQLFATIRPRMEYIARCGNGEDPESLVAEVTVRCWAGFPTNYQEEHDALAADKSLTSANEARNLWFRFADRVDDGRLLLPHTMT